MPDTKNLFTTMNEDFKATKNSGKGIAYSKLSTTIEQMNAGLREYAQEMSLGEMKTILEKLKGGKDISASERDQLRIWIVGDAEYYLKMENNFDDWAGELDRLVGVINEMWTDQPDMETLQKIRGVTRDALRTIADIFYYIQQQERVDKFNNATKEIDQSERLILVRLLEQKISSPHF